MGDDGLDGDHYKLPLTSPGRGARSTTWCGTRYSTSAFSRGSTGDGDGLLLRHLNKFGLPLDNRAGYTKLDWTVWTATLADKPEAFEAIMHQLGAG